MPNYRLKHDCEWMKCGPACESAPTPAAPSRSGMTPEQRSELSEAVTRQNAGVSGEVERTVGRMLTDAWRRGFHEGVES